MAGKKRMPPLRIDEVILLVDSYFQTKEIKSSVVRSDILSDLSNKMRSLPFYPELCSNPAFRSPSGMEMQINNLRTNFDGSKKPYGQLSAMRKEVYSYYCEHQNELRGIAECILTLSNIIFLQLPEYKDYIGGQLPISYHHYLEVTDKTVLRLKNACLNYHKTECVVCGDDLEEKYGDNATSLLEAHMAVLLSQHRANMSISTTDILLLCPACHRLAHSNPGLFDEANLKKRVKEWQQHV